jgi:hypothetical protein
MGKFKDAHGSTRIEKWAKSAGSVASPILEIASKATGIDALNQISKFISGNKELSDHDKLIAMELIKLDINEATEITNRWVGDMSSDSWLSKNVRPITLLYILLVMTILVIGDSVKGSFKVEPVWVSLIENILITVIFAYFGSRGVEKYANIRKK